MQKEQQIIGLLRKDCRINIASISNKTGIASSTVFSKLRRLEQNTIFKYATLLNFSKLGFFLRINLALVTRDHNLTEMLRNHPHVNSVYVQSKGLYVETVFRNLKQYYTFLESLNDFNITQIDEHHVIEDIAREKMFCTTQDIFYPLHMR